MSWLHDVSYGKNLFQIASFVRAKKKSHLQNKREIPDIIILRKTLSVDLKSQDFHNRMVNDLREKHIRTNNCLKGRTKT